MLFPTVLGSVHNLWVGGWGFGGGVHPLSLVIFRGTPYHFLYISGGRDTKTHH